MAVATWRLGADAMPHKLLLADDSVTIQRVIELTFADEGITVVTVSDGDQAIARLAADPPDIVLADAGMPGKDGYEVAAYVRETPALSHIPVVLLTGAFEPVDQARAAASGVDAVLAKPFEPQQVIRRVRELLAGGRGAARTWDTEPPAGPSAASAVVGGAGETTQTKAEFRALGEYFDALDAAFQPRDEASEGVPDLLLSPPVDASAFVGVEPEAGPPAVRRAAPAPGPVPPSATVPSLADAFAVLLAAEQGVPGPPSWPVSPAADVSDEVVERVARRVLAELSDGVVRQAVSDLVSDVAERLVREEIERIKHSIR